MSNLTRPNNDHKAGFTTYYRLGFHLSKHLVPVRTYDEIGRILGLTKRNAYTLGTVTLGKLAFQLRQMR